MSFERHNHRKKVLLCGATGFIGRNLLNHLRANPDYQVYATCHTKEPPDILSEAEEVQWIKADLTHKDDVNQAIQGKEIVIQAAATTSGSKEILSKPYYHVTDNAVMNALIFRSCHEKGVGHLIFFSCTIVYPDQGQRPLKESDFNYQISEKYFGAGWTKVYHEKMCEFYSRMGPTKYTAIRHSNIYGPFDKFDFERSHVFGATVAKVMSSPPRGKIVVWGDGSEERDLLYVDDLIEFVEKAVSQQKTQFELINVGAGEFISVRHLVEKIVEHSGKDLEIEFDETKPTIPFHLRLNIDRAKTLYQWSPRTSLDEGIVKTLDWYRCHYPESQRIA